MVYRPNRMAGWIKDHRPPRLVPTKRAPSSRRTMVTRRWRWVVRVVSMRYRCRVMWRSAVYGPLPLGKAVGREDRDGDAAVYAGCGGGWCAPLPVLKSARPGLLDLAVWWGPWMSPGSQDADILSGHLRVHCLRTPEEGIETPACPRLTLRPGRRRRILRGSAAPRPSAPPYWPRPP